MQAEDDCYMAVLIDGHVIHYCQSVCLSIHLSLPSVSNLRMKSSRVCKLGEKNASVMCKLAEQF